MNTSEIIIIATTICNLVLSVFNTIKHYKLQSACCKSCWTVNMDFEGSQNQSNNSLKV